MTGNQRPIIGITPDVSEPKPGSLRVECSLAYSRAVADAGGLPIVLPPLLDLIPEQLEMCRGFVLTGGDDPRMEMFGAPTHPRATAMHTTRQKYEVALLRELESRQAAPVLGVCLGMQLMALCAGGKLNQHMPDDTPTSDQHAANARHSIRATVNDGVLARILAGGKDSADPRISNTVVSHHRQAVSEPGRLRVAARAEDGVIEAIDDPARRFYIGVQWHPERTPDPTAGAAIFRALVEAARSQR